MKYSRQRECIKNNLACRTDHPTAEMVYSDIREIFPKISLGTVYRNLSLLNDLGEIRKIPTGDGADHFDGCVEPHGHFLCRVCGGVSDLDIPGQDELKQQMAQGFEGRIEGSDLRFFGVCANCIQSE